jgi:hypothetical protein
MSEEPYVGTIKTTTLRDIFPYQAFVLLPDGSTWVGPSRRSVEDAQADARLLLLHPVSWLNGNDFDSVARARDGDGGLTDDYRARRDKQRETRRRVARIVASAVQESLHEAKQADPRAYSLARISTAVNAHGTLEVTVEGDIFLVSVFAKNPLP